MSNGDVTITERDPNAPEPEIKVTADLSSEELQDGTMTLFSLSALQRSGLVPKAGDTYQGCEVTKVEQKSDHILVHLQLEEPVSFVQISGDVASILSPPAEEHDEETWHFLGE